MQETFGASRKRAATFRRLSGTSENPLHPRDKLSGTPENVLHPRKRLSGERKMCGIYLNFG